MSNLNLQRAKRQWKQSEVADNMPAFIKQGGKTVKVDGTMVNASGDINAYDNTDLARKISALHAGVESGDIAGTGTNVLTEEEKKERHAFFSAGFSDPSSDSVKIVAEVFNEDIVETMNRTGFTTQLIARKDLTQGVPNQIKLRRKDIVAFQVTNDGEGITQHVGQEFFYPKTYKLQCHWLVDETELDHAGPELLDDKYQDSLEAILVRQDNILRTAMLATVGTFNAPVAFGTFTPSVVSSMRTQIMANGLPAANMTFSFDIWDDMITGSAFQEFWEPVHKYQLIMDGKIGSLLGMNLITDGFRVETLKVLEAGEVFVTATPAALGQRGVFRDVESTEVNQYPLGIAKRGGYLLGTESMHVMDRAVVYGRRG